jgi:hypothetical protein
MRLTKSVEHSTGFGQNLVLVVNASPFGSSLIALGRDGRYLVVIKRDDDS